MATLVDELRAREDALELAYLDLAIERERVKEHEQRELRYEAESVSLNAWVRDLSLAVQRMDGTAQKETTLDHTGEEVIVGYRFKTGAFHALLALLATGPKK